MPELPEVETIKRDLAAVLKNRRIMDFKVKKPRLLRNPLTLFKTKLVGASILSVKRRAKLLLLELSSGYTLVIHLKMTGQLVWCSHSGRIQAGGHPISGVDKIPNKFTYITLNLSDGARLYFNDVRQFGYWQLIYKSELSQALRHYGPEPLESNFGLPEFVSRLLRHSRTKIKSALLNQSVVAGLGNIYVDEVLFVAKVRPERLVSKLRPKELLAIKRSIVLVLKKAVASRGTSFNTYVDGMGRSGTYWQKRFVYGRTGEPCAVCGRKIKRSVVAGRGTHYCTFCQQ